MKPSSATDYEGALRLARGIVHRVEMGDPIQPMHSEEQLARALIGLASPRSETVTCPLCVPSDDAIEAEIKRLHPHGHYKETPSGMTGQDLLREMARFVLRGVYPLCSRADTSRSATATLMASAQGPAGAATVTASTQGNAAPQGSTTSDQSPGRDPGVVPAVAAPLSRDDKDGELIAWMEAVEVGQHSCQIPCGSPAAPTCSCESKMERIKDVLRSARSSVAGYEMTATRVELTRRAQSIIGSMRSIYEVPESMIDELRRLDEAFHAPRSARREKEIAFARAVLDNLPYLENLITQRGHESALMREHPAPCIGHDFCLMRQAQKGADAIREAGLDAADAAERDGYVPGGK